MESDCIFCKIIAGEIPSKKAYEDDDIIAIYDIQPKAPVHLLVIPKRHITGADEITTENSGAVARIFERIPEIAKKTGAKNGYRVITNVGSDAGQTISHLHFHILARSKLPDF